VWVMNCRDPSQPARKLCPRNLPRRPAGVEAATGHERSWQRGKGAGTRRIASAEVGHV
jgi:hypothetical protein